MDTVTGAVRRRMMSAVRGKNTRLELAIRSRLFRTGLRYALHRHDLPGKPDLVLPAHSTIIFIHGCFWHLHGCRLSSLPATNTSWWNVKLEGNRARDRSVVRRLMAMHWRVLVIWECSIRRPGLDRQLALDGIARLTRAFLQGKAQLLHIPLRPPVIRTPVQARR